MRPTWIDTHCHLDAPEFDADRDAVVARAGAAGVGMGVLPAVSARHFDAVCELAHRIGWVYAIGIHPMYVMQAEDTDLDALRSALMQHRDDPRLVAVGEIGLDFFVQDLKTGPGLSRQQHFYEAQVSLAREFDLPVILHVRRSADALLPALRRARALGWRHAGIAHAFNGSAQQAQAFVELGFKLGFGGAVTFDRALQLRRLAQTLPAQALVLETDAPDMPPHWRYVTSGQRAQGTPQGRNEPAEVPAIAQVLADLRQVPLGELAAQAWANAQAALPRLAAFGADQPVPLHVPLAG
jgi:TatD DNase family protein